MFRDLLTREAGAPQWYELVQIYRRLEARGEIRGGRFIAGVAGEQFALGDSIRSLRQLRDDVPQGELVVITAADPLNLVGILTEHPRVISTASNRVAYWNGKPLAALQGGEVLRFADIPPEIEKTLADKFRLEFIGDADPIAVPPPITTETAVAMPVPSPAAPMAPAAPPREAPKRTISKKAATGPTYPNGIPRPRIS